MSVFQKTSPSRLLLAILVLAQTLSACAAGDQNGVSRFFQTTSAPGELPNSAETLSATPETLPTPDPWREPGRVTILIMGLDYGDWESEDRTGPPRSDTMILLTVDPVSKTAGMLSIPRDLWVSMPGIEGEHKINTAHRFGDLYDLPGGGPGLALMTVEELLDVPINYYATVDFYAFEKFIDELGGVPVDVPEEIVVDPLGPGNTLVLQPGLQTLAGPAALGYARNRSTPGGDWDRAARQQQVILAIRDKLLALDNLPRLILKAPALYRQVRDGVRTNLTLDQAVRLAWLAREIDAANIQRASLDTGEVSASTGPDGAYILIPNPDGLRAVRDQLFPSAIPGQPSGMTEAEMAAAEASRVTIVDETGQPGLGASTAQYLQDNGLNVIEVVKSEEVRAQTRIVDQAHNPYSTRFLFSLLQTNPAEIWNDYDLDAGTDLVVYLGQDWVLP